MSINDKKTTFIRTLLTKRASCKFTYCLYFPPVEYKTKTKIVLGILKTFSLLAYYDMYKPKTPSGRSNFYDFYSAASLGVWSWKEGGTEGGGHIFLSESGQLSIHEETPYVVLGCSLLPAYPYLTRRRGSHADHGSVYRVACSVCHCRRQDHTALPSPLHSTQFKSYFTHLFIFVSFVWP